MCSPIIPFKRTLKKMTPSNFPQRFTLEPEKETSPPSASRTLRRETTFCPFYSFTRDHEVHATTVLNYSSDKATTCLLAGHAIVEILRLVPEGEPLGSLNRRLQPAELTLRRRRSRARTKRKNEGVKVTQQRSVHGFWLFHNATSSSFTREFPV